MFTTAQHIRFLCPETFHFFNMRPLVSLILALVAYPATAANPVSLARVPAFTEGLSVARLARVDNLIQGAIESGAYLGAVTLISRNGKIVHSRALGNRDLAGKTPMTRDTIFRIYSMTKTVTSVALLMLMEEGKLSLDDPVSKFIPAFAKTNVFAGGSAESPQSRVPKRPITIRHLLTHTGGFATRGEQDGVAGILFNRFDPHESPTLAAYTGYVAKQLLASDPGERFSYDGVSIEPVSHLIEVVSGMSFDAFLQQRILTPLKMHDTGFRVSSAKRNRVADMVTTTADGRLALAATKDANNPGEPLNNYPSGAGGLYSTANDYFRFCQMLLNGGSLDGIAILGRKTVDLMMMNQLAAVNVPEGALGKGEGFGLGGYVVVDAAQRGRAGSPGQFGWSGAGSTYFTIDRQEKLIAILLMQHLPQGLANDPPKMSARFYNTVYQSLAH